MKLIQAKSYDEMSRLASNLLIEEVKKKPNLKIGFATGKTPLGMYRNLAENYKKRKVSFSKVKAFNLDEYYPIKHDDKKSFRQYLIKNLFSKINIKNKNIKFLDSESSCPEKECKAHEKKAKKADVLILGVGVNGHIAFNEPRSSVKSKTRFVKLSVDTLKRNKILKNALTIGISTILSAKKIILLASGNNKIKAIRHLLKGKPSKIWPVTSLKKHKNLTVILDKISPIQL